MPSRQPTGQPSNKPSRNPSRQPSGQPSAMPSRQPTGQPSHKPSRNPSRLPIGQPSALPSRQPTGKPTHKPSRHPSIKPSSYPSLGPSKQPTRQPSQTPSQEPTRQPSRYPSVPPTRRPTRNPSAHPSFMPSTQPTGQPSRKPSRHPSIKPSNYPSFRPSTQPTRHPSRRPTVSPFSRPTGKPSVAPTKHPTPKPTVRPSVFPGNWTALTLFNSTNPAATISADQTVVCGGQQCLQFSNINGEFITTQRFPWKTTSIVASVENTIVLAGVMNQEGNSSTTLASIDFDSKKMTWGKISTQAKLSAISFNPESNRIITAGYDSFNRLVVTTFDQASGMIVWEKMYPVIAEFSNVYSMMLNGVLHTYIAGTVDSNNYVTIKLNEDGSVVESNLVPLSFSTMRLNAINCVTADTNYMIAGSVIQTNTGHTKAFFKSYSSWSHAFLGGINSQINAMLFTPSNLLYLLGDATGFGVQDTTSDLILIKMKLYTNTFYDALRISSTNGENITRCYLYEKTGSNALEMIFTVGDRIAVVFVDASTLLPAKLPPELKWDFIPKASLQPTYIGSSWRINTLVAEPSNTWSSNNTHDLANYTNDAVFYTQPSATPTNAPTASLAPTELPPTSKPTATYKPSQEPSTEPTTKPPTQSPTTISTGSPTFFPTIKQSARSNTPSQGPTFTRQPTTRMPTEARSKAPPSSLPSSQPSTAPFHQKSNDNDANNTWWIVLLSFCIGLPMIGLIIRKIKHLYWPVQIENEENHAAVMPEQGRPERDIENQISDDEYGSSSYPSLSSLNSESSNASILLSLSSPDETASMNEYSHNPDTLSDRDSIFSTDDIEAYLDEVEQQINSSEDDSSTPSSGF